MQEDQMVGLQQIFQFLQAFHKFPLIFLKIEMGQFHIVSIHQHHQQHLSSNIKTNKIMGSLILIIAIINLLFYQPCD